MESKKITSIEIQNSNMDLFLHVLNQIETGKLSEAEANISNIKDENLQAKAQTQIAIARIFEGDVASAKEMLQTLGGKLRDETLHEIAAALAKVNADFANEIAEKIKDAKLRNRSLGLIAELRNL